MGETFVSRFINEVAWVFFSPEENYLACLSSLIWLNQICYNNRRNESNHKPKRKAIHRILYNDEIVHQIWDQEISNTPVHWLIILPCGQIIIHFPGRFHKTCRAVKYVDCNDDKENPMFAPDLTAFTLFNPKCKYITWEEQHCCVHEIVCYIFLMVNISLVF